MYKRNGMEYAVYVNEEKGVVTVKITNAVEQLANEFAMFCQKHEIVFDGVLSKNNGRSAGAVVRLCSNCFWRLICSF